MATVTDTATLIHRYFELASQTDTQAYFAQFTEDAAVEDEGVQRKGVDAIRAWRTEVPRVRLHRPRHRHGRPGPRRARRHRR